MAYTLDDMEREAIDGLAGRLRRNPRTIERLLAQMAPEERLKGLAAEERLKGLDPAVIEAWLATQRRDS